MKAALNQLQVLFGSSLSLQVLTIATLLSICHRASGG